MNHELAYSTRRTLPVGVTKHPHERRGAEARKVYRGLEAHALQEQADHGLKKAEAQGKIRKPTDFDRLTAARQSCAERTDSSFSDRKYFVYDFLRHDPRFVSEAH